MLNGFPDSPQVLAPLPIYSVDPHSFSLYTGFPNQLQRGLSS